MEPHLEGSSFSKGRFFSLYEAKEGGRRLCETEIFWRGKA